MVQNILDNTPQQVQRRVASSVAKEVATETGSNNIKLPTGGRPLSLTVGPPKEEEKLQISHKDIDALQATKKLTGKQTLGGMKNDGWTDRPTGRVSFKVECTRLTASIYW